MKTFTSVVRKERAELLLETRTQHHNEVIVIFTEEMKKLFRHADPEMTEEKNVRFLMRGVKQELFAGLARNPPKTVTEFVTEAGTIEKALDMRSKQYDRQVSIITENPAGAIGILTDNGAIIDLQAKSISFSADHAVQPKPTHENCATLRIS